VVVRLGGLEIRLRVQRIGSPAGEVQRVKAKTLPDAAAAGGVETPAN
jgi:hypothetical protein